MTADTSVPTEVDVLQGDVSKAHKELGLRAETSFTDLAAEMVKSDLELLGSDPILTTSLVSTTELASLAYAAEEGFPFCNGLLLVPLALEGGAGVLA